MTDTLSFIADLEAHAEVLDQERVRTLRLVQVLKRRSLYGGSGNSAVMQAVNNFGSPTIPAYALHAINSPPSTDVPGIQFDFQPTLSRNETPLMQALTPCKPACQKVIDVLKQQIVDLKGDLEDVDPTNLTNRVVDFVAQAMQNQVPDVEMSDLKIKLKVYIRDNGGLEDAKWKSSNFNDVMSAKDGVRHLFDEVVNNEYNITKDFATSRLQTGTVSELEFAAAVMRAISYRESITDTSALEEYIAQEDFYDKVVQNKGEQSTLSDEDLQSMVSQLQEISDTAVYEPYMNSDTDEPNYVPFKAQPD